MSSPSELVDILQNVANIFLRAVESIENRMMMIEQRLDQLERTSAGSGAYGAPPPSRGAPVAPSQATPSVMQDNRRAPPPIIPPPAPPQPQAYASPQPQWGAPRQDSYPQPPNPGYQSRPPAPSYPQQGQQQQPQGYAPQGYAPQGQSPPQQQGPPGPRPPANPLNIRQEMTGELKDIFARMRARAEGRQ
ncbi:MAG: hypothetical protein WED04_01550 [Promethearchaeati archaeon SRVP18_Atabeyarchaeia-1]